MDHEVATSPGCVRASALGGSAVFNPEGERIGHVDDLVISRVEGRAVFAILAIGEVGAQFHPVPWASLTYDPSREGYVATVTNRQLERAPTFEGGREPDWNDRALSSRLTDHYSPPVAADLGTV